MTYNDPTGHFALFAAMAIGAAIGAIVNVGIYAIQHRGSYTGEGWAKAALTGAVSGAIAVIPIPGLQVFASSLVAGAISGVASWDTGAMMDEVTGNSNSSDSVSAAIASAVGGAVGGGSGSIIGSIVTPLAGSLSEQLGQGATTALANSSTRDFAESTLASAVPSSLASQISSDIIDPGCESNSSSPSNVIGAVAMDNTGIPTSQPAIQGYLDPVDSPIPWLDWGYDYGG